MSNLPRDQQQDNRDQGMSSSDPVVSTHRPPPSPCAHSLDSWPPEYQQAASPPEWQRSRPRAAETNNQLSTDDSSFSPSDGNSHSHFPGIPFSIGHPIWPPPSPMSPILVSSPPASVGYMTLTPAALQDGNVLLNMPPNQRSRLVHGMQANMGMTPSTEHLPQPAWNAFTPPVFLPTSSARMAAGPSTSQIPPPPAINFPTICLPVVSQGPPLSPQHLVTPGITVVAITGLPQALHALQTGRVARFYSQPQPPPQQSPVVMDPEQLVSRSGAGYVFNPAVSSYRPN